MDSRLLVVGSDTDRFRLGLGQPAILLDAARLRLRRRLLRLSLSEPRHALRPRLLPRSLVERSELVLSTQLRRPARRVFRLRLLRPGFHELLVRQLLWSG